MKKIYILISLMIVTVSSNAQDISLVTSGEGRTKNEATAAALRSAIEQSFGVFVSANTTTLNDDIVRDEVATVASGNIKSYKELSCVQNNAGIYNVSVNAVVSIGKLISYAKAHGSSAEFAGQTFAMNIKMRELNKKNEREALHNLLVQLKSMQDNIFNYEIRTGNPKQNGDNWEIPVAIAMITNENYQTFLNTLNNTLQSLSLSETEQQAYRSSNTEFSTLATGLKTVYLRSNRNEVKQFAIEVCDILNDAQQSCVIVEKGGKHRKRFPLFGDISMCDVGVDGAMLSLGLSSQEKFQDNNHQFPFSMVPASKNAIHLLVYNRGNSYNDYVGNLQQKTNYLFASSVHMFSYTSDEIGSVAGFEVSKFRLSTLNGKKKRFEIIADAIGFPYEITDGTAKLIYMAGLLSEVAIDINIDKSTLIYKGAPYDAPNKIMRFYNHNDDSLYSYLQGYLPGEGRPIYSRFYTLGIFEKRIKDSYRGSFQIKNYTKEEKSQKQGFMSKLKNMMS